MEKEKSHENNADNNHNIINTNNDIIDSKNNLNTQIQLNDNIQDNADIIQINNNNAIMNKNKTINNNINCNISDNNNIIKIELNNKNNEEKKNNDSNISILKQITNKNLSRPITNQDINGNNIMNNQSPNQVAIVYQQSNDINKDVSCREKYPSCFWNIKLIFCYNCCDDSEENQQKTENASTCNTFCLIALLYYLIFIISEILLFVFILLKYIFICLSKCFSGFCEMWEQAQKEAEIKRQQERESGASNLNKINDQLKRLESEHDKVDRRIFLGNPLNDPGYQARVIDSYDRKYIQQKESLERERDLILKRMSN